MARRRRGPIGCLLKFVFSIVFFVFAIVGVIAFMFYDGENDTPVDLYTLDFDLEGELTSSIYQGLGNLDTQNSIEVAFTEDQINKIIFLMIRESINEDYLPNELCTDPSCLNVSTVGPFESTTPMIDGKSAQIKGIYVKIIDGKITVNVPMDAAGFKTRAYFSIDVVQVGLNIELRFDAIGIGKIKLTSGLGKALLPMIMEATNLSAIGINQSFEEKGLPIELDMANLKLIIKQDDLSTVLQTLLPSGEEDNLISDFLGVLVGNSSVTISLVGSSTVGQGKLSLGIDLEKLSQEEQNKSIPSYLNIPFNQTSFITNQTQGLLLTTLVGTPKFVFMQSDFNRMIYSSTNGFVDFGQTIELPNSDQEFTFGLDAIWFEMTPTNVNIITQVNINGFITRFRILTTVQDNNTTNVKLMIQDTLDIGYDLGESEGEYAIASSKFLIDLIGPSISSMNVMGYDETLNAFILDSVAFNEMLNLGGTGGSPISVESISIKNGRIEIEISSTDSALNDAINNLSNIIETVLGGFDTVVGDNIDLFDTTGDQEDAVNNVIETVNNIADILNDPEQDLTEAQIEQLLIDFNELSPENQEIFANLLQGEVDDIEDGELAGLYELLFGTQP